MKLIIKISLLGLLALTSCEDPAKNDNRATLSPEARSNPRSFTSEEYAKIMQGKRKAAQARKEGRYER